MMQDSRTFRVISPLRHLAPAFITCLVALGIVYFTLETDEKWIVGIVAGVMAVGLGLGLWLTTRTRLEITPQQIIYHGAGYRVRSSWDNITGCEMRVLGASDIECLILRKPGMEMSGWMSVGAKLMPAANVAAVLSGRPPDYTSIQSYANLIPVGIFDTNWRTGEIGALIAQYAPDAL
jgi:hypothetical protein